MRLNRPGTEMARLTIVSRKLQSGGCLGDAQHVTLYALTFGAGLRDIGSRWRSWNPVGSADAPANFPRDKRCCICGQTTSVTDAFVRSAWSKTRQADPNTPTLTTARCLHDVIGAGASCQRRHTGGESETSIGVRIENGGFDPTYLERLFAPQCLALR